MFPAFAPCFPRRRFVGGFEFFVEAAAIEVALELGDVPLPAVIAAHLVEDFDEDGEERVILGLADNVRFLIDVEQNAFRRNGDDPLEIAAEHLVVAALGQEQIESRCSVHPSVFEQESEYLQQM